MYIYILFIFIFIYVSYWWLQPEGGAAHSSLCPSVATGQYFQVTV